jgi:ankyrin repeat protein
MENSKPVSVHSIMAQMSIPETKVVGHRCSKRCTTDIYEFARMLLKRGARVNAHDSSRGRTPLHCAVGSRNIQAVQLLLEHGADVNVFDKLGWTSSWSASALCDHEIMKLLSKYGAKSVK